MPYNKPGSFQGNLDLNSGNSLHFLLYFPIYPSVLETKYNPDERDIAETLSYANWINLSFIKMVLFPVDALYIVLLAQFH